MITPRALSRALTVALCAGLAGLASPARADQIFVFATGQIQGVIHGWWNPINSLDGVDLTDGGVVEDMAWSVISPRDAASGLPTGRRVHRPLTLRVRMSAATLWLGNALTRNENLTEVKLRWFVPSPVDATAELTRDVVLRNASVASFSTYTVKEQGTLVGYVDFAFTYQYIGIQDSAAGVSYEDDWETQSP